MRDTFLPFALPDVGEAEIAGVNEVLASGWLTTGARTHDFEKQFAQCLNADHAIAVNSCTAAMHLALEAVGVEEGDEIITTPYTFAATAEVIHYLNAKPVFIDIEHNSFNMNPDLLEAAVTDRTKVILPVHIAGLAVDMDPIRAIAQKYNLFVIEDAAHAFPAHYKGCSVGTLGDIGCFSFYSTKTITTGEGGMLVTNNEQWAERCRLMALHGISKDAWKRYHANGSWYYDILAPGYKYNLTDIAAAIGLVQLDKAKAMLQRRQEIARCYNDQFACWPELEIPYDNSCAGHAWHLYMLRLNLDRLRIDRNQFIKKLHQRHIGVSVHFIPLHIHSYYRDRYGYSPQDYPVAYGQYCREISLPIYSRMNNDDVHYVVESVIDLVEQYRA